MKKSRVSSTHPCVFKSEIMRTEIDPRVAELWPKAPFGDLRNTWRQRHCAELNPYDSGWCPYTTSDCALSFLGAVQQTVGAMPRNRMAYFRTIVHTMAMGRAERKPLAREKGPGHAVGQGSGAEARRDVRGAKTRPTAIGEVLGALAARSRQRQPTNGSEGTE